MHIEKFEGIFFRENAACVRRDRGGVGRGGGEWKGSWSEKQTRETTKGEKQKSAKTIF